MRQAGKGEDQRADNGTRDATTAKTEQEFLEREECQDGTASHLWGERANLPPKGKGNVAPVGSISEPGN